MAIKVLKARIYKKEKQEQEKKFEKKYGNKLEVSWGNQIRSYVFHPYNMIKDHRTNFEVGNIQSVLDGNLDEFIKSYLFNQKKVKKD